MRQRIGNMKGFVLEIKGIRWESYLMLIEFQAMPKGPCWKKLYHRNTIWRFVQDSLKICKFGTDRGRYWINWGNPLNYHCFTPLFSEVTETKIEKPRETRELIKHCIQPSHNSGFQLTKTLVERTYDNHHKMLSSSAADLGFNFKGCAK